MRAPATDRPRYSTEKSVEQFAGIKVGDRVRVTAGLQWRWKCNGVSPRSIEARARVATVQEIVISEKHGWSSFKLVTETSFEHWQSRADLELVE